MALYKNHKTCFISVSFNFLKHNSFPKAITTCSYILKSSAFMLVIYPNLNMANKAYLFST